MGRLTGFLPPARPARARRVCSTVLELAQRNLDRVGQYSGLPPLPSGAGSGFGSLGSSLVMSLTTEGGWIGSGLRGRGVRTGSPEGGRTTPEAGRNGGLGRERGRWSACWPTRK